MEKWDPNNEERIFTIPLVVCVIINFDIPFFFFWEKKATIFWSKLMWFLSPIFMLLRDSEGHGPASTAIFKEMNIYHLLMWIVKVLVTQSCLTLWDSMDCSPQGSSVHRVLQARILEAVAISFSRGSSQPRDWTQFSCVESRLFTVRATWEAYISFYRFLLINSSLLFLVSSSLMVISPFISTNFQRKDISFCF